MKEKIEQEKPNDEKELRTKVITIRMQPSIHKRLMEIARASKTSLSKFMIKASIEKLKKD